MAALSLNSLSMENLNKILADIDAWKPDPVTDPIVKASGQRKAFVVVGLAAATVMLLLMVFGIEMIANVFAILPIYPTIKAIQQNKDAKQWLSYWITFSLVVVVEEALDEVFLPEDQDMSFQLSMMGFLYFVAKIGAFFWLAAAHNAATVFDKFIEPTVKRIEALVGVKAQI